MDNRKILLLGGALSVAAVVGFGGFLALDGGQNASSGGNAAGSGEAAAAEPASNPDEVLAIREDDRILGEEDAPVTIVEYSSLTCPHCASFHTSTLPEIKEEWIDSGRAKLVYRHYPLDAVALSGAQVANCLEGRAHFGFIDMLFAQQSSWARAEDPVAAMAQSARLAGLDEEEVRACAEDQSSRDAILAKQLSARDVLEVQSTPTFFINGEKVEGAQPYDTFNSALQEAYEDAGGGS